MASAQGIAAKLEQTFLQVSGQNLSSSAHHGKALPAIVPRSKRRGQVAVTNAAGQASSSRGSVKAHAVATAPAPGLSRSYDYSSSRYSSGKTSSVPSWAVLTDEISFGPCPRSNKDFKSLVENTGMNALLLLETDEGCKRLGLDWNKFREHASQQGLVAVRVSMKENDQQDQAASLPEAVRATAALAALGYKVHIASTSGVQRSSLVALGYLTFVKAMDFKGAVNVIRQKNPAAQPSFDAWEEAKSKISAGEMKRVAQIAHAVTEKRVKAGREGAPTDDWLVAQRLLVSEAFERGISADVDLSSAIAQAATIKATKTVFEELTATKVEAERAKSVASSSKDRLEFFARHLQALKDKEEAARKSVAAVVRDKDTLSRQVESLRHREEQASKGMESAKSELKELSARVAILERQEADLKAAAGAANKKAQELQLELRAVGEREAAAKKEAAVANAKLKALAEKFATLQASLSDAKASKDQANLRVQDVLSQIKSVKVEGLDPASLDARTAELSKKETAANAALASAQEKLQFVGRQMDALKSKEAQAQKALEAANEKAHQLTKKVEELTWKEAAAVDATKAANQQIAELRKQLAASEKQLVHARGLPGLSPKELDAKVKEIAALSQSDAVKGLEHELLLTKKRETKAADAVNAANDRIAFYQRRMELMKEKENKALSDVEKRVTNFQQQAAELRSKLSKADEAALLQERRIEDLSLQVTELQKSETLLREKAKSTVERMEFFGRYIESLREKEAAARAAAKDATAKVQVLHQKMSDLVQREAYAMAASNQLNEKVANLLQTNAELLAEVSDLREREAKLAKALDDGTGVLQVALQADETIKQLRVEAQKAARELLDSKLRADKLAGELERELIAAGKKPKHYNDIEKVPSSDMEREQLRQLATMQQSLTAPNPRGTTSIATLLTEPEGQLSVFRNFVLGILGMAAVPVTLMSIFAADPPPSRMETMVSNNETDPGANQLFKKPIIQPAAPEDFCRQVPSGMRSARAERFCNSLAEVAME